MRIEKRKLLWALCIVPFLKPDCIIGTVASRAWSIMDDMVFVGMALYLLYKIVLNKHKIIGISLLISVFYFAQVISSYANGLPVYLDVNTFLRYTLLVVTASLFLIDGEWSFVKFLYDLFKLIIFLNFISVILFYNKGINKDSYNTPIYFWSTKNHIISITLAALLLGEILHYLVMIPAKKYHRFVVVASLNVFLMKSSTAIIALCSYFLIVLAAKYLDPRNKVFTVKNTLIAGVIIQFLIVVVRIQDLLAPAIEALFHKNASLTGRTGLWDQAFKMIGSKLLLGYGNPLAKGVSGWLTMVNWNAATNTLDPVYYVAHNQFLEIFLNGGLTRVVLLLLVTVISAKQISRIKDKQILGYIAGATFAFLIVAITEVVYPYPPCYLLLLSILWMSKELNKYLDNHDTRGLKNV